MRKKLAGLLGAWSLFFGAQTLEADETGAISNHETLETGPLSLRLGPPSHGGSGCPDETVSAALSPDRVFLSVLYDAYQVEVGGVTGKTFDRKTCNLSIPVEVPDGFSISLFTVDYRGFNDLPNAQTSAQFQVEYFFAGRRGPVFMRNLRGPLEEDFTLTNTVGLQSGVWSGCGEDVILRTNTSIRLRAPGGSEALATLDSQDVQAALVFQLNIREC